MNEIDNQATLKDYLAVLLLCAAAFAAMSPALFNGFVDWDDVQYVVGNPALRGSWTDVFTFYSGYYHPLTILTYKIEFSLFGLHPLPYHLANLLLHAANCAAVFWLFRVLGTALPAAFLGGLLFCVHPLHAEAAAWVSGRKELLLSLFSILSLIAYIRYLDGRGRKFLLVSTLVFFLAVLAKPTAAIFPLLLPLADKLRGRRFTAAALADKAPYLLAAALMVLVSNARPDSFLGVGRASFAPAGTLASDLHSVMFYLQKFAAPAGLSPLYPAQTLPFTAWLYLVLAVLAIPALVYSARRAARALGGWNERILFGAGLFLIAGLPGFVVTPPADRYMYLPLAGLCLIYGELIMMLAGAAGRIKPLAQRAVIYFAAAHLLLLAGLSFNRTSLWHDSMTLWSSVLAQNPAEPTAYYGRGSAYRAAGMLPEAAADYTRCLEIEPGYWKALANRGHIYAGEKQFSKAEADYTAAIAINPASAQLFLNRGNMYAMDGKYARAVADYDRVLALAPGMVQAQENRSKAARLAKAIK